MLDAIYQYILRFNVSMCYREHGQVIETSEDLIGINFDEKPVDLLFFDNLVEIITEVVHNDVKVLWLTFIGKETVGHDQIIWMFKDFQYLMLPIFIFFIL